MPAPPHAALPAANVLVDNPTLLLFVVAGAGFLVARVRVAGFSLGVAAVLFAGIAASAIDARLVLPEAVWTLGLALFVYTVGLASGPGFVSALRRRGIAANGLVLAAIAAATGAALGGFALLDLSGPTAAGVLAGSLTNTPALAAALEALKSGGAQAAAADPVVGYSLAYPLGVIIPLLAVWALLRRAARTTPQELPVLVTRTAHVAAAGLPALAELRARRAGAVTFGRVRRGEEVLVADGQLLLLPGDDVTVVGPAELVEAVVEELGGLSEEKLSLDRGTVDFRRIVVSAPAMAGRRLADLGLGERFGATVTRVRRGDVDIVAEPDTTLELGDRVRVVAPRDRMAAVTKAFGDSYRALGEIDVLTFAVGIAIGLAIGAVRIPTGGGGHFELGFAGGPLIVGLVLGALGRTGPLVWQLPYQANLTLRQLGTVLFLAGVGTKAGSAFAHTLTDTRALRVLATGVAATLIALAVTLVAGAKLLHLPPRTLAGVVAGMQTQPAVLAFAAEQSPDEREVNLGYATVYPVVMIGKILIAQLVVSLTT